MSTDKMKKEYLAEEFVEAYNDYRKYLNAVMELLENPALEYLVLGVIEKTERKMKAIFELRKNGMSTDEAFGMYRKQECNCKDMQCCED